MEKFVLDSSCHRQTISQYKLSEDFGHNGQFDLDDMETESNSNGDGTSQKANNNNNGESKNKASKQLLLWTGEITSANVSLLSLRAALVEQQQQQQQQQQQKQEDNQTQQQEQNRPFDGGAKKSVSWSDFQRQQNGVPKKLTRSLEMEREETNGGGGSEEANRGRKVQTKMDGKRHRASKSGAALYHVVRTFNYKSLIFLV